MAQIILDEGLATELKAPITSFNEDIVNNTLSANYSINIAPGSVFPNIPKPASNTFTTIKLVDDNEVVMPVVDTYNHIADYSTNYYEAEHNFNFHMAVDNKAE